MDFCRVEWRLCKTLNLGGWVFDPWGKETDGGMAICKISNLDDCVVDPWGKEPNWRKWRNGNFGRISNLGGCVF